MSDWEDDYDESGVAIDRAPRKQPPPERYGTQKWSQRENVSFGMKALRSGRSEDPEPGERGRAGARPLVFNVEKAVVGAIIGELLISHITSQNIAFFQLTSLLIS